jgi:hypothetical protein
VGRTSIVTNFPDYSNQASISPTTPSPPDGGPANDSRAAYYLLAAAVAFVSSLPGLLMGLHADDWFQVRPRTAAQVIGTFFGDWNEGAIGQGGFYRPLVRCSFALDQFLHGSSAPGCHLTNAILFTLATVAVARIARLLCGGRSLWALACLTALFVLNPLRCESLFWVSGRTDLLAGTLVLWATAEGLAAMAANSSGRAVGSLGLLALGLLSKEVAIAGCAVLPAGALLLAPSDGSARRVRRLLVVAPPLLGAVYLLYRTRVLGGLAGYERQAPLEIAEVLGNLAAMLSALFCPWQADGPAAFRGLLALPVGILSLSLCLLNGFRRSAVFCLLAVVFSIAPMALIRISPVDGCRVLFLPLGFLALFFCGVLFHRSMASWRKGAALLVVMVLALSFQPDHLAIVGQMIAARAPADSVRVAAQEILEGLPAEAILVVPEPVPTGPRRILDPGAALMMALQRDWLVRDGRTSRDGTDGAAPGTGLWLEDGERRIFLAPNLQPWMERRICLLAVDAEGRLRATDLEQVRLLEVPGEEFAGETFRFDFADEQRKWVHALQATGRSSGQDGWSAVGLTLDGGESRLQSLTVSLDGTSVYWADTTPLMGTDIQAIILRRVAAFSSFQLRTLKLASYRSNQSSKGENSSP